MHFSVRMRAAQGGAHENGGRRRIIPKEREARADHGAAEDR